MGFDDQTTSEPVDPRSERVHDDNYVLNELKALFLGTEGKSYGTPSLTNDDETLLQVSTTGTYDGLGSGTKVYGDHIDATGGGPSPVQGEGDADVNVRLGQNNEMVLLANGIGNSPTITATVRMVEDW